jgi:16S rRNA (guanine527-N7)-methyltransferase
MIPTDTEALLRQLLMVFLKKNEDINLSALRTEEACWTGNVLDSLALLDILPTLLAGHSPPEADDGWTLADIGTGGGFPLLPLAIAMPHATLTGFDSVGKKMKAVQEIAHDVGINTISLVTERVEELGHEVQYREQFDIACARAVAPIATLLEYCAPFVKPNGYIILWKSLQIDDELAAAESARQALALSQPTSHVYELPGDFGSRQLLIYPKKGRLPKTYPRAVGIPKKTPL